MPTRKNNLVIYNKMKYLLIYALSTVLTCISFTSLIASDPVESDYYQIDQIPIPEGVVLETSGIEMLPNGKLAVCGRRGNVYVLTDPSVNRRIKWTLYAEGLHDPLNLAYDDGWLYCTQRGEVTRMQDTNDDDRADIFETVNDGWGITGDYHEYALALGRSRWQHVGGALPHRLVLQPDRLPRLVRAHH